MAKHKHADIMMECALVAQESETPWEEFEYKIISFDLDYWKQCTYQLSFSKDLEYRRKPKMSKIGDYEYPTAEKELPKLYTPYFYPNVFEYSLCHASVYEGFPKDYGILNRGMFHLNKENAIAHAKAIILASGGKF